MADARTHTPFTETAGIQCFAAAWPQPALPTPPPPFSFYNFNNPNGVCGPATVFTVLYGPASVPPRSRLGPAFGPATVFT